MEKEMEKTTCEMETGTIEWFMGLGFPKISGPF